MQRKRTYGRGSAFRRKRKVGGTDVDPIFEYYGPYHVQKVVNGQKLTATGRTEKEAWRNLDEKVLELTSAEYRRQKQEESKQQEVTRCGQELLKSWLPRWQERYKGSLSSQRSLSCVIRRINRLRIAKLALQDIRVEDAQDFLNEMRDEKKFSLRTQEYTFTVLNDALNAAEEEEYISKNPCRSKSIKKPHVVQSHNASAEKKVKFWDDDEIRAFIETYKGKHTLFNFFYLMLLTGCRKQEVCALHWDDVDWKNKMLRIDSAIVTKIASKEEEGVPKTDGSADTIALDDEAIELLKQQRKDQIKQAAKYKFQNVKNWVFTSRYGKHYSLSWPTQQFKEMCEAIGIRNITVHGLRHTHASLLFKAGLPIEEISRRLRHVNILVTSNFYLHLDDEIKRRAADKTQNIMLAILTKKDASDNASEAQEKSV